MRLWLAITCFFKVLFNRDFASQCRLMLSGGHAPQVAPKTTPADVPPAVLKSPRSEAITLLATLVRPSLASFEAGKHLGMVLLIAALFVAQLCGARWHYKERVAASNGPLFALALAAAAVLMIWFTPAATVPFIYFQF